MVVGGHGFIGHNVVINLLKLGHNVAVVDNMRVGNNMTDNHWLYKNRLDEINKHGMYINVPWAFNTKESYKALDSFKPQIIIFMPGPANQRYLDRYPINGFESLSTHLVEYLDKCHKIRRFVYISSSMVYGDFYKPVKETDPLNPIGLYGIGKMTSEMIVRNFTRETGVEHTIVRPSAVYGAWDNPDRVVAKFMTAAIQNKTLKVNGIGEQLDFTHVSDAATGIVKAALSDNAKNKTYNITNGNAVLIQDVAQKIVNLVGTGKVMLVDKDKNMPSRAALDITQAMIDFDYSPKIDIDTGIQDVYNWIIKSPYYLG